MESLTDGVPEMTDLKSVGILGAGTMGHALALVHAAGGLDVRLTDNNAETLARAPALIASALDTLVTAGAMDEAAVWIAKCDDVDRGLVEAQQALESFEMTQEEILQQLDRAAEHLKQILAEQKLEGIVDQLQAQPPVVTILLS